ncbi:MAG: cytochrome c family protein [Rhizobiales bacterium]|nr:cytochrome c family protein [Hyphomicrobiales bacterium]
MLLPIAGTVGAQDADAGKGVFRKCMACHDAEKGVNKLGPTLKGVVGRTAGTEAGFNYSAAMKAAGAGGLVWDEQNLSAYLADPKAKVAGNRMAFPGLKNPQQIKDVIAYLKSVSG